MTADACPISAAASISAYYLSARAAAGTVVSGTTYPLALWPVDVTSGTDTTLPNSTTGGSASITSSFGSSSSFPITTTLVPSPTTTPSPSPTPTGPTGFHVVALKCDKDCEDALEIVPSASDDCTSIATNQEAWWGGAFPPGPEMTENESK